MHFEPKVLIPTLIPWKLIFDHIVLANQTLTMVLPLTYLAVLLAYLAVGYGLQPSDIPHDTPLSSLVTSAKSHLANGSPRDALMFFDAAIARDPTNFITIFQRGAAYLSMGKSSQASEDFDRVLSLKPDFEGALLQRSRLKAKNADWNGALGDLEKAGKKKSPEYQAIQGAQSAAHAAQSAEKKHSWESCVKSADAAIAKAGMSVNLRQIRSHCHFERGEVEEGIRDLSYILQVSPGLSEEHLQLSSILFYGLGDVERGLAQIRKCLHADPESKACNGLFRREKKLGKQLASVRESMGKKKFANAANMLVGSGKESDGSLLDEVKEDIRHVKEAGYIRPSMTSNLYAFLVGSTCDAQRQVCVSISSVFLPHLLIGT